MNKILGGLTVVLNEEGYLQDFNQWNRDVALEIAKDCEVDMCDDHWKVIDFIQQQYQNEIPLSIRKIGKSGVVSIKEFYQLFPNGPLKKASRIAGIPKPVSCI